MLAFYTAHGVSVRCQPTAAAQQGQNLPYDLTEASPLVSPCTTSFNIKTPAFRPSGQFLVPFDAHNKHRLSF